MPFPNSINGKLVVDSMEVEAAISAVEAMLRHAEAGRVTRTDNHLDFTGGMFRLVVNWNLLVPISSGRVAFRQLEKGVEITYRLSFMQMILVILVMVVLLVVVSIVVAGPHGRVLIWVVPVGSLWLFWPAYVITLFRFPSALRAKLRARAAEDLGRRSSS